MSYVRFGEHGSDVYIYWDIDGEVRCCGCLLTEEQRDNYGTRDHSAMVRHVERHRSAGHHVPEWVEGALDDWPFPDGAS